MDMRYWRLIAALGLAACTTTGWAEAGNIFKAEGVSTIERSEQTYRANQGGIIRAGDAIQTGPGANLQWRFVDDSVYSMGADSTLKIVEFAFGDDNAQATGLGKLFLFLESGGFRTVSGKIGKANPANYLVETPAAKLSILGTGYTIVHLTPALAKKFNFEPGTYVTVESGSVSLSNKSNGQGITVSAGQIGFVGIGGNSNPTLVPVGPEVLNLLQSVFDLQLDTGSIDGLRPNDPTNVRIEPLPTSVIVPLPTITPLPSNTPLPTGSLPPEPSLSPQPSASPSPTVTITPTASPSASPSASPTGPTASPSISPSASPSPGPSVSPSPDPSASPSPGPSVSPSASPTASATPTASPTASPEPTEEPPMSPLDGGGGLLDQLGLTAIIDAIFGSDE